MLSKQFAVACIASVAMAQNRRGPKQCQNAQNALENVLAQNASMNMIKANGFAQTVSAVMDADTPYHGGDDLVEVAPLPNSVGHQTLAQTKAKKEPEQKMSLAQISEHTCTTAQEWNKAELDDFYTILNGSSVYDDETFTPDVDALYWADMGENDLESAAASITWQRAKDLFSDHTLYGTNGIQPTDVEQGALGNCWFLAGAATLSQHPERVEKLFLNPDNELSQNGIYGVNFYSLGVPHTVIVDDYLPVREWGSGYITKFSKVGDDSSLWVPILEKAFAKYQGNYAHIEGGDARWAVRTLTNAPMDMDSHGYDQSEDDLWNQIVEYVDNHDIVMAGTPGSNDSYTNADGLVQGHAYNVLGYAILSDGTKLIKMQNPWQSEKFVGDYSDSSPQMTEAVKAELGHTSDDDGQFYMSFSDYYSQCSETYFNIDSSDWYSDAFLKLGDVSDGSGSYSWCGDECTRRMVDLYSEVDQLVYVTAHTWDARSMTDSCEDWTSANMPHSLYVPGDQYVRTFKYGAAQAPSFQMSAGQTISLTTEWNFTNSERNNDWSVVAFGESGTVTLTSSLGASDSLPVITKQDGSGDNNDEEEEDVPEEEEEEDVPIEEDDEEDVVPADPEDGDEDIIIPDEEEEDDWEDDWDWESYDAFFEFVDNHEVSGLPEGYCGSSLYESGAYTSDGEFFWQTAIKSTCDWINSEYTVYMDHDDWWALTTYWYEFDADWNWAYDSIIKECHTHATETDWTGCTFILGQVVPEDYFVTEPLQLTAGWMNAPGQYGIRSYSSKWVWP